MGVAEQGDELTRFRLDERDNGTGVEVADKNGGVLHEVVDEADVGLVVELEGADDHPSRRGSLFLALNPGVISATVSPVCALAGQVTWTELHGSNPPAARKRAFYESPTTHPQCVRQQATSWMDRRKWSAVRGRGD